MNHSSSLSVVDSSCNLYLNKCTFSSCSIPCPIFGGDRSHAFHFLTICKFESTRCWTSLQLWYVLSFQTLWFSLEILQKSGYSGFSALWVHSPSFLVLPAQLFHAQPLCVVPWPRLCPLLTSFTSTQQPVWLGHRQLPWHVGQVSPSRSPSWPSWEVQLGPCRASLVIWLYPWVSSWSEIIYLFLDKPFISVTFICKEIGFLLDVWGGICRDWASPKIMIIMTIAAPRCQVHRLPYL